MDAHLELVSVAANLLHSNELPSPYTEDHEQKSYTASRIAKDAERWREVNRDRAVRITSAQRTLRKENADLQAEVEKLREQHSTDIDTLIEVGREWDEMKAEVERLKGCIISWAECMDICEYKALAKEMRDALALTTDKEE